MISIFYRIFRFFPDGQLLSYVCASKSPVDLRKVLSHVTPPPSTSSLDKQTRDIRWGTFELQEITSPHRRIKIKAEVALRHPDYPRMKPGRISYNFELVATKPGLNNCEFSISDLHCVYDLVNAADDRNSIDIPRPVCAFMPFDVPTPLALQIWHTHTPIAAEL